VTAGIIAPVLDYTHKYKEIYTAAFVISSGSAVWLALALAYKPTFAMLSCALALLGVGAFMILPTALELSVEITHPVAPGTKNTRLLLHPLPPLSILIIIDSRLVTSAGFLWMAGQIVGIGALFAAGALVDPVTKSYQNAVWMLTALVLFGTTVSFLMLWLNPT
jgi:hypothetical protein